MKKLLIAIIFAAVLMSSCRSAPPVVPKEEPVSAPVFSEILGKEWKLIEVWINDINTGFDRNALVRDGFGDMFTFKADEEFISGTGAPNRYTAPYTIDDNRTISISMVRATLMAPIREPEKLKEHDFFVYIQNSGAWNLDGENFTLTSKNTGGTKVFLVFKTDK